jgi:hypothetical protein
MAGFLEERALGVPEWIVLLHPLFSAPFSHIWYQLQGILANTMVGEDAIQQRTIIGNEERHAIELDLDVRTDT